MNCDPKENRNEETKALSYCCCTSICYNSSDCGALAQSQTSNDEAQQLRKLVEQMQAEMSKMQAEIDQLQGMKPETPPSQQPAAPAAPPAQQEGTIETTQPPLQGTTSEHVGAETASRQEFAEDKSSGGAV